MIKILLVEDDPLIQRMYSKELLLGGFDVVMASDGEEGLQKASTENPQLILLDIMMPKKNGFEVLSELKANESTKNIPVIILTNLMHEHDAATAIENDALAYIIKSDIEPREILEIINKALATKKI